MLQDQKLFLKSLLNVANIFTAKSINKNGFNNLSSSVTPQNKPAIYIIVDVGEEDEQMIQAISESSGADTFQISNHGIYHVYSLTNIQT